MAKNSRTPRISRTAENKRSSYLPSVPIYPPDLGYRLVMLCIPNHVNFLIALQSVLAMHNALVSWGGHKDADVGRFYQDWTGMVSNMISCDLVELTDHVNRIATALESLDYKTPEVVSLEDFIAGMGAIGGVDFEQIEAFLNILGLLPGIDIRVDPLKMLLDWIWKSQSLANMYTQSTAQGAIATSLAAGGALQGVLDGIDLAKSGGELILEGINGTSNAMQAIIDLISLVQASDTSQGITQLRYAESNLRLHEQNVILTDMADSLRVLSQQECSALDCLCQELGGQVASAPVVDIPCYEQPEGFSTWEDFLAYREKWVSWIWEKAKAVISALITASANGLNIATDYYGQVLSEANITIGNYLNTWSINLGTILGDAVDALWLNSQSRKDVSDRDFAATSYFNLMLADVALAGDLPEVLGIVDLWLVQAPTQLLTNVLAIEPGVPQLMYDANDSSAAYSHWLVDLGFEIDADAWYVANIGSDAVGFLKEFALSAVTNWGVLNGYSYAPYLDGVVPVPGFVVGDMGCGA